MVEQGRLLIKNAHPASVLPVAGAPTPGYKPKPGVRPLSPTELKDLNLRYKRRVSAADANSFTDTDLTGKWSGPFSGRGVILEVETVDTVRLIRLGVEGKWKQGQFYARLQDIKGMTGEEIRKYLNLDFTPTQFQHVTIPAGQRLFVGTVGPQPGHIPPHPFDGGLQFQIKLPKEERINKPKWFDEWQPLEEL